jgi:hypothetical protein
MLRFSTECEADPSNLRNPTAHYQVNCLLDDSDIGFSPQDGCRHPRKTPTIFVAKLMNDRIDAPRLFGDPINEYFQASVEPRSCAAQFHPKFMPRTQGS